MSDKPHPLVEKLRARLGDRVTDELVEVVENLTNEEQAVVDIMANNMGNTDLVVLDPSSAHRLLLDVLVDLQVRDTAAATPPAAASKCIASGKLFPSGMLWLAAENGAPREYWCPQCHAQWPQLHEDITTREGCAVVPDHKPVPMTEAYAHRQLELRAQWYRARGAAVPLFLLKKGVEAQGAIRLERRLSNRDVWIMAPPHRDQRGLEMKGKCSKCSRECPLFEDGRIAIHFIVVSFEHDATEWEQCAGSMDLPAIASSPILRVDPGQLVTIGSGICQDCGVKQPLTPKGWIPLHTIDGERCGGSQRKPLDHGRACTTCRCYSCNLEVPLTIKGRAGLHFRDTTDAESGLTTHEACPGSLCHPLGPGAGQ